MFKLSLFLLMTFTTLPASALDPCSAEYRGLHNLVDEAQLSRVSKIETMQNIIAKIRARKLESSMVEIDRFYISKLIVHDEKLLEGNIFMVQKEWSPFVRSFEASFYTFEKSQTLLNRIALRSHFESDTIPMLRREFHDDPFMIDLINDLQKNTNASVDAIRDHLEDKLKKTARYLGRNYKKYSLVIDHLLELKKSSLCSERCQTQLNKLISQLGVGSKDEQLRFPIFRNLRRPSLKKIDDLINSTPVAYEHSIITEGLFELKAALRDIITVPKLRNHLASVLKTVVPFKAFARVMDRYLVDMEIALNQFTLINRVFRGSNYEQSLERLKSLSASNPELLTTLARRQDPRSQKAFTKFLDLTQEADPVFNQNLKKAFEKAKTLDPFRPDYQFNASRGFLYLLGAAAAYKYFDLSFTIEAPEEITEESGMMQDSESGFEIIELDKDNATIKIKDTKTTVEHIYVLLDAVDKVKETQKSQE